MNYCKCNYREVRAGDGVGENRLPEVSTRFLLTTSALVTCAVLPEGVVLVGAVDYRTFLWGYKNDHLLSVAGRQFGQELIWKHEAHYH